MTITINQVKQDEKAPLYHKYPQQINPQGAYIEIDCENESVSADWNGEIGNAIPFSVYHGHDRRYGVPETLMGSAINRLFEDADFVALCQRIVAGYESHWDGNNNVARLNDSAQEAERELESILERYFDEEDHAQVYDVREYIDRSSQNEITAAMSDVALTKWASDIGNNADNNVVIDGDIEDFANELRYEKRRDAIENKLNDDNDVDSYRNLSRDTNNPVYEYERSGVKYSMAFDSTGSLIETPSVSA